MPPAMHRRPRGVKDYDFQFKIVLLGDNGVGKTTLLRTYTEGRFHTSVRPHETADVESKVMKRRNKIVKLHIWDTAGLERYRSLSSSYYRDARGCIVLFDIHNEESFNNVSKWVEDAKRQCSNKTRMVLAATKCERQSSRKVSRLRAENLARELEVPYVEISSQQKANVREVFDLVTDAIMDDMRARALEMAQSRRHLMVTLSLKECLKKELHDVNLKSGFCSTCAC